MPDANIKIIIKKPYTKGWLDYDGQIERLRVRGLDVPDVDTAKRFLAYVNYYRFTGYCLRFQRFDDVKKDRVFNDGVCFDDIYDLYVFDRNLRDCVSEALECVEIGFRATVAYYFSKLNGAFGHLNTDRFERKFVAHPTDRFGNPMVNPDHSPKRSGYELWHDDIINETQRSNEIFINHFKQTYTEFPDLPIWVALEICSFGTLSKMFAHMLRCDMRPIATRYSLQASTLNSWMHSFVYVRNICAHHGRLWDKQLAIAPVLPPGKMWQHLHGAHKQIYTSIMMLNWMLSCNHYDDASQMAWKARVETLIDGFFVRFPTLVPYTGFPNDWKSVAVWAKV